MSLHGLVTIHDYDNLPEQPKGLGIDLKRHQLASLRVLILDSDFLVNGINDSAEDANRLADMLRQIKTIR